MTNGHSTKEEFINKWNIDKIKQLTKEEYSSLGGNERIDFTYDLEHKTPNIGSIRGGDSLKFKVYAFDKKPTKKNILFENDYAWHKSIGKTVDEAFEKVKEEILNIINLACEQKFEDIEKLELFGDGVKWKIAFLYAEEGTLVDIFAKEALKQLSDKSTIYEIQKELIEKKPQNKSIFEYGNDLWKQTTLNKNQKDKSEIKDDEYKYNGEKDMPEQTQQLNQILYGPPGTGKTYKTINKALEIIFEAEIDKKKDIKYKYQEHELQKSIDDLETILKKDNHTNDERQDLKTAFEYYKEQGQIEFVTFHQSYGYEEFVEGIKAQTMTDDTTKQKTITYDVEAGTFKRLCEQAKTIKSEKTSAYNFDENINIWKISLGDSQNSEDEYLFDYCIENNKILLGFGDGIDFNECINREAVAKKLNDTEKYSYPPTAINTLKNKIKIGDIVLVSYGNRKLRAIAKITGEYQHLEDDNLKTYVQSRDVEWLLVPEEPFSYEKVLKKQFSQMTIYDIKSNVKIEELRKILTQDNKPTEENNKNYILIIDEINRGNISKIFGELITLIEPSKRIGADEALHVRLPYSNEPFGVPQNLYIIGTMNTADRSIALMDTALRRRFEFTEMMPDLETLNDLQEIEGVNIKSLLETINKRIEYLYDRDHTIGHAYFMSLKGINGNNAKVELDSIFRNKIIPLLQEYFYDDWEKILMVLGEDGFIEKTEIESKIFSYKNDDYIEEKQAVYKIKETFDFSESKDGN